jgi:phosphoribosylformylglycinamidine cyclo-ligase
MLRVFNCGIGMALVVDDAPAALALLAGLGETALPIGRIEALDGPPGLRLSVPPEWFDA